MTRRFAIIGHRAQSSGKLNLNDLAGSSGRIDVLARAVNTALFLSHGIRDDSEIILHLEGGPGPVRRIGFIGQAIRGVHPDERAICGHLNKALKNPVTPIGVQQEIHSGLWHSGGSIKQTISEWERSGTKIYVLDAKGILFDPNLHNSESVGFILSDDQPFTDQENKSMENFERISLGEKWLQGHSCIAIIHHQLDSI
ncbi:MAG: hypothetical protein ACJZ49_01215 [Candidatus Thalassarchaeaceae archaeon]|nr:MAG: hypothetical protein CMA04_001350 [Euryarchaeota archaeon]RPG74047.1 MAG: hypothetical protein CBC45_005305 [Euryarchaeota archaeon TMED85]|tara:strand:- start:6259 stop:6852 length:594 start_codon:yes stop_codon:yes gene_type:complete